MFTGVLPQVESHPANMNLINSCRVSSFLVASQICKRLTKFALFPKDISFIVNFRPGISVSQFNLWFALDK